MYIYGKKYLWACMLCTWEWENKLQYLRLAAALGASTRGAVVGDGVTAAAATAAAAAADGVAAPSQLQGIAGNL